MGQKISNIQNGGQDGCQNGGSKLKLVITEPFINRFVSDLNHRHKIKCQQIKIKQFQNGKKDGCLKFELAISKQFMT